MNKEFGKTDIEKEFRNTLQRVAAPLLIEAVIHGDIKMVRTIIEAVDGPLDHTDLVQAAMETKTYAAGLTDKTEREAVFESAKQGIQLANTIKYNEN